MSQTVGAEVIASLLAAEGVRTVYGIVDGTYLGLLAALEKHGIRLVSPRHETTAVHMAGAHARLTGTLGVCIASNGPGVANALPGVAVEQAEGNRVLLVTSSRRTGLVGPPRPGAYQCFDQTAVTRPTTRWSGSVPDFARLPEMARAALRACHHGRPGVVHLDVPEDVLNGVFATPPAWPDEPGSWRDPSPPVPSAEAVEAVADRLRQAERPVLHAGSGVLHAMASEALGRLASVLAAPVTTSWGARAALPDTDPHLLPVPALEVVDEARATADLVLVLGSRLGETDWWGQPPHWGDPASQTLIQVDLDPQNIGARRPATVPVVADLSTFLPALLEALEARPVPAAGLEARRARLADLKERRDQGRRALDGALENPTVPMHSARVPAACRAAFPDEAVFVLDGGNAAVWANFFLEVRRPNTVLSTWKMGMLGAGIGQALGAAAARPEQPVCCILGDGAMGFHVQEIETAVRHGLPVVFVVMVDRQWGMVKLTQQMGLGALRGALGTAGGDPINADLGEIAYDAVARAMGAHGARTADPEALPGLLSEALASGRPAVLHVDVDPAMHLWAPGLQAFKEMHQEPSGEPWTRS